MNTTPAPQGVTLAELAVWLHAAYDRPPQTPECVAMLSRLDAALAAPQGLTDDEVRARCAAVGIRWIDPIPNEDGSEGYPGGFDMTSLAEMRALLASAPQAPDPAAFRWACANCQNLPHGCPVDQCLLAAQAPSAAPMQEGAKAVAKVFIQNGHWDRGHFHDRKTWHVTPLPGLEKQLSNGALLYAAPPLAEPTKDKK